MATAYKLSESAFKEYQEKVIETVGKKKETAIKDSIMKEQLNNNPISNNQVIVTTIGDTLCYDSLSRRYFKSDINSIKKAFNKINFKMINEGYASANDLYYELNLELIERDDDIGWNVSRGLIEPYFSSQLATDGTPCLVIGYSVEPKYDYTY